MKKRYFYCKLAILAGIFCIPIFALAATTSGTADDIDALNKQISVSKDKMQQLEATMAKYTKIISDTQDQAQSLRNQLSFLDNSIAQIQADLDITKEKIKQTNLEIQALQIGITDKLKTIGEQQKIVVSLVKDINSSDQKNYLEIMLSYNSFPEFYDQLKQVENIYTDVGRAIKNVRLAKEQLQRKQAQLESKQELFKKLQDELQAKKDNLTGEVNNKQNVLAETKSKESTYRTLLDSQRRAYQLVQIEINTFEARVRKKLEEQDKIQQSGSVGMIWPVPSHYINALFHDPSYPFRNVFQHSGIDLKASQGTPVRAAASGYIAKARRCSLASCYSYVLIVHTGSLSTLYGHLSAIQVADDAYVNQGDVIGYSGGTPGAVGSGPFVTGPHLHFEVRLNGIPVDPQGYL